MLSEKLNLNSIFQYYQFLPTSRTTAKLWMLLCHFLLFNVHAWWGARVVICLGRGADLHMAQLMPLPLTVSCSSKIQTGFTFLVPAHPGIPGERAVKRVCVYTTSH